MNDDPVFLILVADDFGMNECRTDSILAAHKANAISRTSLLVNGEDAVRAATLGRSARVAMGLHFNITEGFPVSAAAEGSSRALPLLTRPDGPRAGEFLGKREAFLTLEMCTEDELLYRETIDAVKRELLAQIELFVRLTNTRDVWLDGHNHIHVVDVVWRAIEEVCFQPQEAQSPPREWNVVGIRVPHDPSLVLDESTPLQFREEADIFGFPFWRRISSLSAVRRPTVPPHISVPDAFIGFEIGGSDTSVSSFEWKLRTCKEALLSFSWSPPKWRPKRLSDMLHQSRNVRNARTNDGEPTQTNVVVELMTHLGFTAEENPSSGKESSSLFLDDAKSVRLMEWETYTSAAFQQQLTASNCILI